MVRARLARTRVCVGVVEEPIQIMLIERIGIHTALFVRILLEYFERSRPFSRLPTLTHNEVRDL